MEIQRYTDTKQTLDLKPLNDTSFLYFFILVFFVYFLYIFCIFMH